MGIVQLVESNVDLAINAFLRQSHVLVQLERLVKVSNLTQLVQELVHPCLVAVDERVERLHVRLLGIAWLVGQVLQHLGDKRQCSPRVLARVSVNQHVCLRRNDGWVDETKEEEASNQGTY